MGIGAAPPPCWPLDPGCGLSAAEVSEASGALLHPPQESDLLRTLRERSDANRGKHKQDLLDKYCQRQAEIGVGDCGGLRLIPGGPPARGPPAWPLPPPQLLLQQQRGRPCSAGLACVTSVRPCCAGATRNGVQKRPEWLEKIEKPEWLDTLLGTGPSK